MGALLAELKRGVADALFPPVCVHCREIVPSEGEYRHLCPRCAVQLSFVEPPCCEVCGHPFYGVVEGERLCPHCEGLYPEFGAGRTAVLFKGPARSLVIELKYHRGLHVVRDMKTVFSKSAHLLDHVRGAVLVPVPLHPRKRRERGYNQSELLAEALAESAGGDTRVGQLLCRAHDTQTQTAFDRKARLSNLTGAFALAGEAEIDVGQRYVLIDDVFTTGATLNSCARELRRAGCMQVDVATFGHG